MKTERINWREQIEAAIAGRTPEHIPAIFRMSRWYKHRVHMRDVPAEIAGKSLEEVEAYLGLARSARYARVYRIEYRPPVECVVSRDGDRVITEYRTPTRTLRRVARYGPGDEAAGLEPLFVEYPIKSWEDYGAFVEIMGHLEFVPTYEEYERYDQTIGEAGLPMVVIGAIPFHHLLLEWTGYQKGYLDLYDRPDVFLEAVEAGNAAYRPMWERVAASPARLLLHGVNFDTQMTPPPVFHEHFLPYLKQFNHEMHLAGKKVACHADGNMVGLLDLTVEAGFDAADCFACEPLVECTVTQARQAWRDRITIWGGLPSTLLESRASLDALRDYLQRLYTEVAPGDRFMLGITDMAMPTTSWEHLLIVGEWVHEHRGYPINLPPH